MAERRMFARSVLESDTFIDLPAIAQSLYLRLSLSADDDGFVNSPSTAVRICRAEPADLDLLEKTGFLLRFPSGLTVIRHWHINNLIRSDRYRPTRYQEEIAQLELGDDGAYRFIEKKQEKVEKTPEKSWYTQDRLGKESLEKELLGKLSLSKERSQVSRLRAPFTLTAEAENVLSELRERERIGDTLVTDPALRRAIEEGDEPMYAALSGMRGGLRVPLPSGKGGDRV